MALAKIISLWPSYWSEVSCIGPNQNDCVLAQLQVGGQRHCPYPKCFRIGPATGTRSVALARAKLFRIRPIGPRSAALARAKMISYWPSYRSNVSCIGPSQNDCVWPSYKSEVSGIGRIRSVFVLAQ